MMNVEQRNNHPLMKWSALAAGTACLAGAASTAALPHEVTHRTVLVEEFTATWCYPCSFAYDALERAHERWGDQISILSYNISDVLATPFTEARASEWFVSAIPTFVFHSTYKTVGTPGDGAIDNYITQSQNQGYDAEIIGSYMPNQAQNNILVRVKLRPWIALNTNHEVRIVVWEETFDYNWYRSNFKFHVNGGLHVSLGNMNAGKIVKGSVQIDASTLGTIQTWDDLGVTMYIYDKSDKSVVASWDLGEYNLGDLNGDLNINNRDAQLYIQQLGKDENDPDFNPAADWNGDNVINSQDTDLFRDYIQAGYLR